MALCCLDLLLVFLLESHPSLIVHSISMGSLLSAQTSLPIILVFYAISFLRIIFFSYFFQIFSPNQPHLWDALQLKAHTLTWEDMKEHQDPEEHWNTSTPTRGLLIHYYWDSNLAIPFQTAEAKRERWNVHSSFFLRETKFFLLEIKPQRNFHHCILFRGH